MKRIFLCPETNDVRLFVTYAMVCYRSGVLFLLLLLPLSPRAQEAIEQTAPYKYRIVFNDKDNNPYSVARPEEFLSARAIERRLKQDIGISYNDLPVTPSYIDSIRATGVHMLSISKWFNSVTFETTDESALTRIGNLSFVKKVVKSTVRSESIKTADDKLIKNEMQSFDYGTSLIQTEIHNGSVLHDKGFTGQGMHIAVIDNGFFMVDKLPAFSHLWDNGQILGTRDFVNPGGNVFDEDSHGMKVFSIIGGFIPGMLVGTATGADFWLLRSEVSGSEYIIEEDNWISAAEFADSAGVDIINTSLGYTEFDDPLQDHRYSDMDGNNARISVAAELAASKGILVIISAGNEGDTPWQYISAPADADSILAVGAIGSDGRIASFSSRGPSYDGRIKPDVVAMGKGTYYAGLDSGLWTGSGTSLSAPVITGLAACLWQSNPEATAMDLHSAVRKSAHLYTSPDTIYGYGIPDFNLADAILKSESGSLGTGNKATVFPNPFQDEVYIFFNALLTSSVQVDLFNQSGTKVVAKTYAGYEGLKFITISTNLASLPKGIYILRMITDEFTEHCKLIKQ